VNRDDSTWLLWYSLGLSLSLAISSVIATTIRNNKTPVVNVKYLSQEQYNYELDRHKRGLPSTLD
jgi:hypothetical protein